VFIGAAIFLIQSWRLESYTCKASWNYHARICIERLPSHAWSAEGIKQILGDICVFDHMEESTFQQDNMKILSFFAWMGNPDLLPHSEIITFFSEQAGQANVSHGPLPAKSQFPAPPEGRELVLLIHIDHYTDWSLHPDLTPNSGVSGLPSSSSDSSTRPFQVFNKFDWISGIVDSQ
jgi:hypothetical protein